MVYECTGPRFEGILNRYTGEPMKVRMAVSRDGRTRYFSPDTYSTADRFPTAKEAYRAWNRVDGVEGLKDGRPITCAYTGVPLKLVHDELGWGYAGGFDPHLLYSRADFLRLATMRDGEAARPGGQDVRVDAPPRRGRVTDAMRRHAEETAPALDEDSVRTAEAILQKHRADVGDSPTVSMHVPAKGRRRR